MTNPTSRLIAFALGLGLTAPARAQSPAPSPDWPLASPASVGLDSARLAAFATEIGAGRYGLVDRLLVIRNGKLAFDRAWTWNYDSIYGADAHRPGPLNAHDFGGPYNYFNSWWHPTYRRGELHSLQSVTKTIVSVIIGAAINRGDFPSIDTPVLRFFDTTKVANIDDRKRRMTVRHLLTMTAGIDWNEGLPYTDPANSASQMEASSDWVAFTINRPMSSEPGSTFAYSSGASAVLAAVFRSATGTDIEEYAARHLFAPLGIRDWFWKRTPTGLADTEGGLYLRPTDLAKIWQLFLDNGLSPAPLPGGRGGQGQRIVSAEWIRESVKPAASPGGPVKYGLKWWLVPYGADPNKFAWTGSGFGGQVPIAIPEYDLVIVVTAWNVSRPGLGRNVVLERVLGALK